MTTRKLSWDTARKLQKAKVADLLGGVELFAVGDWTARDGDAIFTASGCRIVRVGEEWCTLEVDGERVLAEPDERNALPIRLVIADLAG